MTVNGTAGQTLNITAQIANLPASLANIFVPTLAAEGTISGTVTVTGKPAAPVVGFQTNWSRAATSQTKSAGLGPLGITANGQFANNTVTIDTSLTGQNGLALNGGGTVAVAGSNALAMKFSGTLPFDAMAGQLAAQGLEHDRRGEDRHTDRRHDGSTRRDRHDLHRRRPARRCPPQPRP